MNHDTHSVFSANLRNYATEWSLTEYTREEGLWPIERELITTFMAPPPARIADLGCGAGRTTVGLAAAGYQVTAIDLAESLIARARARHPHLDFRVMDATRLSFDDASFDAALFSYNGIDVIFPVAGRERCMAEAFRILKPGGVFVMSTHNALGHIFSGGYFYWRGYRNGLRFIADQRKNPHLTQWYFRYDDPGGPQWLFSAPPAVTERQLRAAGFEIVDVRGNGGQRRSHAVRMRAPHVYFTARKRV